MFQDPDDQLFMPTVREDVAFGPLNRGCSRTEVEDRIAEALAARGYAPRHALQAAAIGRVATALFLRTYERAERVHLAMVARGWTQTMPRLHVLTYTRADAIFLGALAASLLSVRVIAA